MKADLKRDVVDYRFAGGCANITLNRPEVGNALNATLVDGLNRAFDQALREGARMIVLRGGGKHLCTGFDLGDVEGCTDGDLLLRFVRIEQLLQKVYRCPVTTVAVGAGRIYGAGADLFTCCDRRIGLPGASFAFPGSGFGLILGTRRLAARIGNDAVRRILIGGKVILDTEAARIGLVTDQSEAHELDNLLGSLALEASRLTAPTVAALYEVTHSRNDDADLAALVNSASIPGLKDRIQAYRAAMARSRVNA